MPTEEAFTSRARPTTRESDAPAPLRVALAGLRGIGLTYLKALQQTGLELVAVADADADACRSAQNDLNVPTYEDFRSMLVESSRTGLDMIVVALEAFESRDLIERAGHSGITVVHRPPFARNALEARGLLSAFAGDQAQLIVSRFWHFEPTCADLPRIEELIGSVHTVSTGVTTSDTPQGWRGDAARSGGGVLLNGAYPVLDLLVATLGCPESAYARRNFRNDALSPRTYDTEDSIALSLRFTQGCIANLTAVRGAPYTSWSVTFHGTGGVVELSDKGWRQTSAKGENQVLPTRETVDYDSAAILALPGARTGAARLRPTLGEEHLPTLATVDAAYLSIRTGAPESPRQFLT